MNAIAFATKRAFHGFLRVSRKLLASFGLTAARFDLLYTMLGNVGPYGYPRILQSELRKQLGVTAGVVSRMVRALEKLGWVKREVCSYDTRQRCIKLTEQGEARMLKARRAVVNGMERLVDDAICFGRPDPGRRFRAMADLESFLDVLRRHFGDRATLYYPWGHPDD
jgi:DNA-binding MarR family transcriptional regulator